MWLNFQTQADIRNEIRIALAEIGRPATAVEIGRAIWTKCAVDGTMKGVLDTIRMEVERMGYQGDIEKVDPPAHMPPNLHYYRPLPLDRLAAI